MDIKTIKIVEKGTFCAKCGTCKYIDYSYEVKDGEYYCEYMAKGSFWNHVSPDETACKHYEPR